MKNIFKKTLGVIIGVMLFITPLCAQAATLGDIATDTAGASTLFSTINDERKEASRAALTQDSGLDQVAYAYASELYSAGSSFRKTTDFRTLPDGKRVYSLAADNGVYGLSSFYYSVWFDVSNLESTPEFITHAVNGDYANVGIARCTDANGFKVVVLMFSK